MRTLSFAIRLGLALCLPAMAAHSEEAKRELLQPPRVEIASPITDRFALTGLYSTAKVTTDIRYDQSPLVPGTSFRAEDLLGLQDRSRGGAIELMLRMGERNRLRVDYFKLTRDGDTVLDQPLVVGDSTYRLNDRLMTHTDLRMLGLTYTYSFLRRERVEVGGGLGVFLVQAEGVGEVPARRVRDTFDGVVPMPTLALDGSWRAADRWSVNGRVQYLVVHTQGVKGSFSNYQANLQYRAWHNLAAGVGYSKRQVLVNSFDPGNTGRVDFQFKGPEAFLRASF